MPTPSSSLGAATAHAARELSRFHDHHFHYDSDDGRNAARIAAGESWASVAASAWRHPTYTSILYLSPRGASTLIVNMTRHLAFLAIHNLKPGSGSRYRPNVTNSPSRGASRAPRLSGVRRRRS